VLICAQSHTSEHPKTANKGEKANGAVADITRSRVTRRKLDNKDLALPELLLRRRKLK